MKLNNQLSLKYILNFIFFFENENKNKNNKIYMLKEKCKLKWCECRLMRVGGWKKEMDEDVSLSLS